MSSENQNGMPIHAPEHKQQTLKPPGSTSKTSRTEATSGISRWRTLRSQEDRSTNHVIRAEDGGLWEARYMQRCADYAIAYLSSHSGCRHACRFCHLTQSRQTTMLSATLSDYRHQLERVLTTYRERRSAPPHQRIAAVNRLHINFMARGEALSNPTLISQPERLFDALDACAQQEGIGRSQFNVSTIIPKSFIEQSRSLMDVLSDPRSVLYYSLYSVDPAFRKRWLPKALAAEHALDLIADYQVRTGREIVLHWAMIEGHNDRDEDIQAIIEAIRQRAIKARFNLVRYNPYGPRSGKEPGPDRLQVVFTRLALALGDTSSRILPRVGFDVKASCGMFVEHAGNT